MEQESMIQKLLSKKWLLIAGGTVLLGVLAIMLLLPEGQVPNTQIEENPSPGSVSPGVTGQIGTSPAPSSIQTTQASAPTPTISVELQKAIDEAKSSAAEYDKGLEDTLVDYPWIRKLPLGNERYYIYFDLDKKVFIGKLYLREGEDSEALKMDVINHMIARDVPHDMYRIEWVVLSR